MLELALWMLSYYAPIVLAIIGAFIVELFAHELGHALVALRRTSGHVTLGIGSERPPLCSFGVRRLHIQLAFGIAGFCAYDRPPRTRLDIVLIAVAGPAASLLTAGAAVVATATGTLPAVFGWTLAVAGLVQVGELWPQTYRADSDDPQPSDGLVIAHQLGWLTADHAAEPYPVPPDASV